jgi:hypothetical protein
MGAYYFHQGGGDDICEVESACNYGEEESCHFDYDCDGVCGGMNWDCDDWALDDNLFGSWTAESSIEYDNEECTGEENPGDAVEGDPLLTLDAGGTLGFNFVLTDEDGNPYECQEDGDCDDFADPYMSNYGCNSDNECVSTYSFSWATNIPNDRFCLVSWWHNACIDYSYDTDSGNFSWIQAEPGGGDCEIIIWVPEYDGDVTVDHNSGWNLVGLPLVVEDPHYQTVFPDAIDNTLFGFSDVYFDTEELIPGKGYWLRFENIGTTTINGSPIDELTISLSEGWNLVSVLHFDLSIDSINDPDSIIVPNTLFGFSDVYFDTEELVPGKGYWLRAFQDGEVSLIVGEDPPS